MDVDINDIYSIPVSNISNMNLFYFLIQKRSLLFLDTVPGLMVKRSVFLSVMWECVCTCALVTAGGGVGGGYV